MNARQRRTARRAGRLEPSGLHPYQRAVLKALRQSEKGTIVLWARLPGRATVERIISPDRMAQR